MGERSVSNKASFVGLILPILAGCSSISIEFTSGGEPLVDEARDLEAKAAPLSVSPSVPLVNGVTMNGVMWLGPDLSVAGERSLGDFQATVNFASGSMTGAATGFVRGTFDATGNPTSGLRDVAGTVTASSVTLSPGATVLVFDGAMNTGSVVEPVSGTGAGRFLGVNGDMFESDGTLTGDATATVLDLRVIAD